MAPLLLLHKQVHDKRGIAESLHAQITRARLTACEVGLFQEKYHHYWKYTHPPLYRSHLSSLPMGLFWEIMVHAFIKHHHYHIHIMICRQCILLCNSAEISTKVLQDEDWWSLLCSSQCEEQKSNLTVVQVYVTVEISSCMISDNVTRSFLVSPLVS